MYKPETLETAIEVIADLEYENDLLQTEIYDLKAEIEDLKSALNIAETALYEYETEQK